MGAFGVAHCFFISAFGFRNLRVSIGISLALPGIASNEIRCNVNFGFIFFFFLYWTVIAILVPNINNTLIAVMLPVYSVLVLAMSWRAMARVDRTKVMYFSFLLFLINLLNFLIFLQDFLYVTKVACAIGSILFVISDGLIAIDKFYTPVPHRTVIYFNICIFHYLISNCIFRSALDNVNILCCSIRHHFEHITCSKNGVKNANRLHAPKQIAHSSEILYLILFMRSPITSI